MHNPARAFARTYLSAQYKLKSIAEKTFMFTPCLTAISNAFFSPPSFTVGAADTMHGYQGNDAKQNEGLHLKFVEPRYE